MELANNDTIPFVVKQGYNKKAFDILADYQNDSLARMNLFKVANRFYNMDDSFNYIKTVEFVLKNSLEAKDTLSLAKAYAYKGDYFGTRLISDSAFLNYYKSEKLYLIKNDLYNVARTRLNKANLQYAESDLLGSEKSVFNALRILKYQKANDLLYELYNLLGILYNDLEEYDKSIDYHTKALANATDDKIPSVYQSRATSLNNIGYVYQNLKNYQKAQEYYQEGLRQKNLKYDKPSLYAMLLDNLAYSRFRLREDDELPGLFLKSLKLRDSLKLTSGIVANKIHLSEYYSYKNDDAKAVQYAREALTSARNDKNFRNVLVALKQMGVVEPQNATLYSREYIHINDSLQKAERKMGEKFSRIEYETDVIKSENTDLVVQNRNLFYVFSILTLIGVFTFVFVSQRNKHRELMFKEQQQIANAEIYNLMISQQKTIEENRAKEKKRVARELHDGVLGKIFGVRMNLDTMNTAQDQHAIKSRLEYLAELKQIEQDIREISHDLNRENTELINNFVVILNNLIENQRKAFKTKLNFTLDKNIDWANVSNEVKINLYRMLQEALQNCNKYAKASLIAVDFKKESNPEHLKLCIADDGIGFNLKRAKKGIGLQNIAFRTKECKGKLEIKTKPGEGTQLIIEVPIENPNNQT
ncbi:tetratricopeptide repeat-containing sensor histidine kinase [Flavobacterium sp. 9R]|uniref:tetratricopeptide repeat-containing sensor histidine kinase n=1 Tax=Flavobacterium sp. 9R TaxID=2653143 RepID=UPI001F24519B|nr:tetratricopeptide repeat-containing sensor histidine kinase [Flavobacterium sp. 9R]